jgi:hypothetical protein
MGAGQGRGGEKKRFQYLGTRKIYERARIKVPGAELTGGRGNIMAGNEYEWCSGGICFNRAGEKWRRTEVWFGVCWPVSGNVSYCLMT